MIVICSVYSWLVCGKIYVLYVTIRYINGIKHIFVLDRKIVYTFVKLTDFTSLYNHKWFNIAMFLYGQYRKNAKRYFFIINTSVRFSKVVRMLFTWYSTKNVFLNQILDCQLKLSQKYKINAEIMGDCLVCSCFITKHSLTVKMK